MENIFNFETFAGGALAERVNAEMEKVLNNIADPNTAPTKTRKLTLSLTFKPGEDRQVSDVNIEAKTSLQAAKPINTHIMIDRDINTGRIMAAEIRNQLPGQIQIDLPEPEKDNKVIDLQKKA